MALHEVLSGLPASVVDRILQYQDDLIRFNRGQNLVSRATPGETVDRLLAECVVAARQLSIKENQFIVDVGSGAGLPGIVFGVLHQKNSICLVERRRGRCDFLTREAHALGLINVTVRWADIQSLEALNADVILAKAVATPEDVLRIAERHLVANGWVGVFRSREETHRVAGWVTEIVELRGGLAGDPAIFVFRRE